MKAAFLALFSLCLCIESKADTFSGHCRDREPDLLAHEQTCKGPVPEMIETALERLGHKIVWSEVPWKRSLETAKQGMVDILPRHSMNEERKTFLHAIAYGYKVRKIFYMISPKKDIIINSLDDLLPYTVGMLRGSFYSQTFAEDKRLTKLPFGSNDQMIRLLESGRLDIAITSSAHELEKFIDIKGIKQAHYSDSFFNSRNISIPARSPMVKHFAAFKHEIEKIIRSGEIEDIFKRHNISAPSQKD